MKNTISIIRCALLPAAILLGAMGCSPDISTYCQDITDCYGGNEYDEDACYIELKSDRKVTDAYGCKAEYDALMTCMADNGRCEYVANSDSSPGYNANYYTTDDLCDTQNTSLDNCMVAADAAW